MTRLPTGPFGMACAFFAATLFALPATAIESRPLHFAEGASSATLKASLEGDQIIDYTLGAKAGQTMRVTLETSNSSSYFNVLPPGSKDVAIFVGSTSGNEWTGALPADGDYTIRVYLMRSAARRNETADYTLTVGITGSPTAAKGLGTAPATDAKVAGTSYHATGQVPCSLGKPGNAEVHVTPPGGFKRVLTFVGDKVTADEGSTVKASKSGDLWVIDVNDYEHYRIPDAVISGG